MIPGVVGAEPSVEVYTDASGGIGCGAWWAPHWLQLKWSLLEQSEGRSFGDQPITEKEVLPVVLACAVWGCPPRQCCCRSRVGHVLQDSCHWAQFLSGCT